MIRERTHYQLYDQVMLSPDGRLQDYKNQQNESWYHKLNKLLLDPTIAMVRDIYVSPILAAGWSIYKTEEAKDEAAELIEEEFWPLRLTLLRQATQGCLDWGWSPFEKIWKKRDDGKIGIHKAKSLLQVLTEIVVDTKSGAFEGFWQQNPYTGGDIYMDLKHSLLFNFDVEGTDWYGKSTTRKAEKAHDGSKVVNEAADRYDAKIAGSHWVIHYPPGQTMVNGSQMDNFLLAQQILGQLRASGGIIVPASVRSFVDELNDASPDEMAWRIEMLHAGTSSSSSFTERLNYLDKLKVRAFGFPERSILEGQFGTKAEAAAHGDFALTQVELRGAHLVEQLNRQWVNQLLTVNFGPEAVDTVKITQNPLNRDIAWRIYEKLLTNSTTMMAEFDSIDTEQLKQILTIPVEKPADLEGLLAKAEPEDEDEDAEDEDDTDTDINEEEE